MNCPSCGQTNSSNARFCDQCGTRLLDDPDDSGALRHGLAPSSGFIGRQQEMRELIAALEDALSGKGRLVMLAGEPGIGKTRTAQELTVIAEERGVQTLWGRCYEEQGTPPYWPWLQALNASINQRSPEQLMADLGSGTSDIAEVVPELRIRLPELEPPPTLEPEQARFRLFSSITSFWKNIARTKSLLLILDDLHWADRSSLLLLEFLAREIPTSPILLLGTYRDVEVSRRHPLSETLGSLVREQRFLRLQLPGLARVEVEQSYGNSPSPEFLTAVHQRTEGNPLFVREIMRVLGREGADAGREYLIRIPEGVRDAIGRRLNRMSDSCNQVLTIASVIGREFDLRVLTSLMMEDQDEEGLLDLLEEAIAARVIDELPQVIGRYQFSHALIQETLLEELSTTRRVRLHARVAEALETRYGSDTEGHAAELARHFYEAEAVLGPDKLVQYALMAGEKSLVAYAWEEAQNHFEKGLAARNVAIGAVDPLPDAESAALLFGLGRARLGTAGRLEIQEVINILSRAFDYYLKTGDASNAIAVAVYPVPQTNSRTGMTQLIRQALPLVAPGSLAEGRLLARYGDELGNREANYAAAQEAFDQALAIARDAGDARLELTTLNQSAEVDWYQFRLAESATKRSEAIELAVRTGDVYEEVRARQNATRVLVHLGEGAAAQMHASAFLALAERVRDRSLLLFALQYNSLLARLMGDRSKRRESAEDALALAPQDPAPTMDLAILEYETGNFSQGEALLRRLLEIMAERRPGTAAYFWPAMAISYAARITGASEGLDESAQGARMVLSLPSLTPLHYAMARCGLALQAIAQGNPQTAAEQYAALGLIQGILVPHLMSGDRLLGLLVHTMGDPDQAMAHFEDSLTFCRRAAYRSELAWTCSDYADTLLRRNSSGDRGKALALLEESLSLSAELGMRPLIERVVRRQEQAQARPSGQPAYPDGLTQREVEVLRRVAAGKNNREIAEELVVSVGTVANHVTSILNKAGLNNRTEAAGYAIRQGLSG